ncbi:hypothetical protein HYH02_011776 [Chlamydomonas schloesseri]|uniref:PHD-type domain-containing protein n=1 Tax=Chlamydomonas schloesseri TaxID=2026947 RepID=A0A835T1A0_9CHLO|nr:hypothetical protein HYH02_011776 [Chlamydomonas schloesseri]|eukprot:KAG2435481.1 hypothetical protein HYH02_011776 [Chlamydomonas schloesseri]
MPAARRTRARGLALVSDFSEATLCQFLQQLARQKNKRVEGVSELTRQQLHSLCVALSSLVERAGPDYWPAEAADDPHLARQTVQNAARTLHGAAALVLGLLTERGNEPPSEQLLAIAQQLHGFLLANYGEETWDNEMMDAVARLCSTWWDRKAPYREELVARTIPYVLSRAANGLNDKGKATWVHNVYAIREALELLDFDDDSILSTKHMLLVIAREPAFLKSKEGCRFIAFLFKLHPSLTQELAAIARNQIAGGQPWVLEAYGDIFFRAWRDTVGPCAAEVENELQRLMQAAILASTPRLAASLRIVLNELHSHKSVEKRVGPLMVRLYDPILPRAFGAANAEVRRNAVHLLTAAFPIMDLEAPAAENNTRMTQQMSLLMESLVDSCPAVREAAVAACCGVLHKYWELIPAATSAKIMSDITTKLAYDGASKSVRVAVLRGLQQLVDNQNAQPVLKKALTGVTALLHDSDPAVREALMDLVLAVTNCRDFKFWELIPPEALLEAVAADADEGVARKIVRLLLPSYFPNADSGATYMAALLRANPGAAQVLCRQLVARYLPAAASSGSDGAGGRPTDFGVSVPLEQLVQVASTLAAHLAATAGSLQTPEEAGAAGPASPPAKRAKAASGRRGKKGAGGSSAAVAGKKRAKKKEAQPELDEEEEADADEQHGESGGAGAASRGAAAADAADEDDDVVLVQERETPDSWVNILGGLALLVEGLGAAVTVRGVDGTEVAAVFDEAGLEELLRAAEDDVRRPEAIRLVLRMVASLHFLPAAARARTLLYRRMARGCIAGLGSVPAEVLNVASSDLGAAARWDDPELVAEVLKTLATGHHAPKLFAMLASALGAREPQPIRRPRNADKASCKDKHGKAGTGSGGDGFAAELLGLDSAGHEAEEDDWEHDVVCVSCKCAEPSDTMLLCDGCDLGCHISCMRPALAEVPAGDWLCWHCEAQVQGTALPRGAAGRCVALLLQMDEPRQLLCSHELFPYIIEQLKEEANQEADDLNTMVHAAANGGASTDEANSAPADSAATATAATAAMVRAALLGDPWGAMTRYCRASLHRSMWAAMPQPLEAAEDSDEEELEEEEEEEEEQAAGRKRRSGGKKPAAGAVARTPAPAARSGRRSSAVTPARPGAALAEEDRTNIILESVAAIDYACQACSQLVSITLETNCGLTEQLAVLHYCQGLLRVLHVMQQTGLVTCTPDWATGAAKFCSEQAALIRSAANKLAAAAVSDNGGAASAAAERLQQQAQLAGSLQVLLGVAHQLAETVRRTPAHAGAQGTDAGAAGAATPAPPRRRLSSEGASEEEMPLSQQLEGRLEAAAAEGGGEQEGAERRAAASSGAYVEGLSVELVELLCDAALAPLLRGAVRVAAADLLGELLAAPRRAARCGWLDTLCRLTGEALSADPAAAAELPSLLQPDAGEAQPVQPQEQEQQPQQQQPENDEDAAMLEAGEGPQADGAVRGVLCGSLSQQPVGRGAGGRTGKAEATAGKAAGSGGASAAAALQELLSRLNPAVGVMANMLERVCAARKAHGRTMLLLASVAAKSLAAPQEAGDSAQPRKQPAPDASALGATVLLCLCQAMAPAEVTTAAAAEGPAAQRTDVRRRGGAAGGRYGALAQEAAAQAVREEAKAAARALGVVRRVLDEARALRPLQPQQQAAGAAGSAGLVARTLLQAVVAVATR